MDCKSVANMKLVKGNLFFYRAYFINVDSEFFRLLDLLFKKGGFES